MKKNSFLLLLLSLLMLVSCNSKKIKHDEQYGVRYTIEETHNTSAITINLDTDNTKYVTAIHGYIYYTEGKNIELNKPEQNTYEKLMSDLDEKYYYISKTADNVELEYFNIEFHDPDFSKKDYQSLLEYLGLWDALSDDRLTYQTELKDNPNFRYNYLITEGDYLNNISYTGASTYDVK
ncbi:MAG: hypothetical protein PHP11_02415 [Erysipelotrichaceae bacterium]|nr:hypothetical protein [Erysipelotrichaceae bacterium]MDD3923936.1 hypothetical protein [Erysipelotrichaceae bacterium]MDD4642687.1 hypothetical protein [Erysipelotrichaceae bacterium]